MLLLQQEKPWWRSASHHALILVAIVVISVMAQQFRVLLATHHGKCAVTLVIKVDFKLYLGRSHNRGRRP